MFNKKKNQTKALANLGQIFRGIAKAQTLNLNDFPPPNKFRDIIDKMDVSKFPKVKKQDIEMLTNILEKDVSKLMAELPSLMANDDDTAPAAASNPFAGLANDKDAEIRGAKAWVVDNTKRQKYGVKFHSLDLIGGKASGSQVMQVMLQSGLTPDTLKAVWELSDIDRDGKMDSEEFALCMYLIDFIK